MFFFGACVTLSGVYLLSCREMNVLRPTSKLRAAVKMIIFIKRVQKAKKLDYHWTLPQGPATQCAVAAPVVKSAPAGSLQRQPSKLSKASVMPIENHYQPGPVSAPPQEAATPGIAADLDASTVEISTEQPNK
jgi:hypothetical protein